MRPDMGLLGSLRKMVSKRGHDHNKSPYRLRRCVRNIRVVFSIDRTSTLVFGVMGEFASLSGLKLRTELMIRPDVFGRVRIKIERQLSVASTRRASLRQCGQLL